MFFEVCTFDDILSKHFNLLIIRFITVRKYEAYYALMIILINKQCAVHILLSDEATEPPVSPSIAMSSAMPWKEQLFPS